MNRTPRFWLEFIVTLATVQICIVCALIIAHAFTH